MTDYKKTIYHSRPQAESTSFSPASKRSEDPPRADCRGDSQDTKDEKRNYTKRTQFAEYTETKISKTNPILPHGPRVTSHEYICFKKCKKARTFTQKYTKNAHFSQTFYPHKSKIRRRRTSGGQSEPNFYPKLSVAFPQKHTKKCTLLLKKTKEMRTFANIFTRLRRPFASF